MAHRRVRCCGGGATVIAQTEVSIPVSRDAGTSATSPIIVDAGALRPLLSPELTPDLNYPDGGLAPFVVLGAGTAADYNGDGLMDYADHSIDDGYTWMHLNNNTIPPTWDASSWFGFYPNFVTRHNSTNSNWEWLVGSFTSGSGRADIIEHWLPSGQFWVHQNGDNGSFSQSNWGQGYTHATQGPGGDPGWEFFAGDFNGDGWADLVEHYRPTGQFWIYENYRDGGFGSPLAGTGIIGGGTTVVGPRWFMAVGDFNHDGYADYADVRPSMQNDTPDAGVWIHFGYGDGGFNPTALWGPADYGAGTELLAGNWEFQHACFAYGFGSTCGVVQYAFHNVVTGALTGVEEDTKYPFVRGWKEISSTTTTAYGTNWETLGTPHRVTQTQTNGYPNGIGYEGSFVPGGSKNLYLLLWHNVPTADANVVINYLSNMNGQSYGNILTEYNDLRGDRIDNSYNYWGDYVDNTTPCDAGAGQNWLAQAKAALTQALEDGDFPVDPTGEYVIVPGPDIQACTKVCNGQCGYHDPILYSYFLSQPVQLQFTVTPDMGECGNNACLLQSQGPNGAPGGDSIVYWITHELGESMTDPGLGANIDPTYPDGSWTNHYYSDGGEGEPSREEADLCQYLNVDNVCPNGTPGVDGWNVQWGSYHFCVQESWANADGGYCTYTP